MMGHVVALPQSKSKQLYSDRLQTAGIEWTGIEKKLIDLAEFLEAMIIVLDDVKLQNIQSRDYGMVEIITEEIARYQIRLEALQGELTTLRTEYKASVQ